MPHLFSNIPENIRMILSQAANIFLVIVLIYIIQYIFNAEFSCTCTPVIHKIVFIYICLIPIILFFILKIVKHTRTKVCGGCCCGIWSQISQLLGICLYWWGFILLDGDLYLCMATKFNDSLVEIPCKKERTLHENSVITIYKNTSQFWGYILIALGFLAWCVISNTKIGIRCDHFCQKCMENWCKIFESILCCECLKNCCKTKPFYKRRYEELLSEETDKYLEETLQEIAKNRAKSICSKHICKINESQTSNISVNVEDNWAKISQSDFYSSSLPDDLNSAHNIIYQIEEQYAICLIQ